VAVRGENNRSMTPKNFDTDSSRKGGEWSGGKGSGVSTAGKGTDAKSIEEDKGNGEWARSEASPALKRRPKRGGRERTRAKKKRNSSHFDTQTNPKKQPSALENYKH